METEEECLKEGLERSLASTAAEMSETEHLDKATVFSNLKTLSKVRTAPSLLRHLFSVLFLLLPLNVHILQNLFLCPLWSLSYTLSHHCYPNKGKSEASGPDFPFGV